MMTMSMPIPIFKQPPERDTGRATVMDADTLAQACNIHFRERFGRENKLPQRSVKSRVTPVCCVNLECGYWQLECNDPDISRDELMPLVMDLRTWENSRAMTC
jgi:hypothetical protein